MNNLFSIRVNMLCFSCSRLRLIPVRACESQIQLRVMEIARKRQEAVRDGQPLCFILPVFDVKPCKVGRDKKSVGYRIGYLLISR